MMVFELFAKLVGIQESLNDSEFQKLQNTLQKIMLGYEDRLNLIN